MLALLVFMLLINYMPCLLSFSIQSKSILFHTFASLYLSDSSCKLWLQWSATVCEIQLYVNCQLQTKTWRKMAVSNFS